MMPGILNTCSVGVLLQDQVTGSVQELGRSFSDIFKPAAAPPELTL